MAWKITLSNGIHLPQVALYCDARRRVDLSFISHAHFDHIGSHRHVVCTEGTSRLLRGRLKGEREETVLAFGQSHTLPGGAEVKLYAAGHVLGSAQLWVRHEEESLLYTGDFKLRAGLTAEPCVAPRADVLIMETTFGLPRYVMPPTEEVAASMVAFCRAALAEGVTPVLMAYSLGKSQEVLALLAGAELPVMMHPAAVAMTKVYESLGMMFPPYREFDAASVTGHVVIGPPQGTWLEGVARRRTAMVSGWALDSGAIYRYGCDAAFALSDHADFPDLLKFVEAVQPKRVYTVHGFAREFAATLRSRGVEAWALGMENQLELGLGI